MNKVFLQSETFIKIKSFQKGLTITYNYVIFSLPLKEGSFFVP